MRLVVLLTFTAVMIDASYNIATEQPLAQKQQLCLTNQAQCKTFCDGNASVNTCDPQTCKWTCSCSSTGKFPTVQPAGAFAIEVEQCRNELLECVSDCLVNISPDNNFCTAKCKNEKQCGTSKASMKTSFYQPGSNDAASAEEEPSSADYVKISVAIVFATVLALLLN